MTAQAALLNDTEIRIMVRDRFTCVLCPSTKHLQVSHAVTLTDGIRTRVPRSALLADPNLITVCASCQFERYGASLTPVQHCKVLAARLGR